MWNEAGLMSTNPCISHCKARGKWCFSRKQLSSEPLIGKLVAPQPFLEDTGPISTETIWRNTFLWWEKINYCGHKMQLGLDFPGRYGMFSLCCFWLLLEWFNCVIHWKADEILKSVQNITRLLHIHSTFIAGLFFLLLILQNIISISCLQSWD